MAPSLLVRLASRDRALMLRCAISPSASGAARRAWAAVTHLGGAGPTILAVALPLLQCCALRRAGVLAAAALTVSHLMVQLVKRSVGRRRPAGAAACVAMVREPDRFSFPSGHAAAGMSIALGYGLVFPMWLGPLVLLALAVGFSRVRLGVHYPSDVVAGQVLAAASALAASTVL